MPTLSDLRVEFSGCIGTLLQYAKTNAKYQFALGETVRTDLQAEINAMSLAGRKELADYIQQGGWPSLAAIIRLNRGKGIRRTVHRIGLGLDLILYKYSESQPDKLIYCTNSKDYEWLGEHWETLHPLARWGGRFGDGGHFSFTYEGIK